MRSSSLVVMGLLTLALAQASCGGDSESSRGDGSGGDAGSTGAGGNGGNTGLPLDDLPPLVAQAMCQSLEDCMPDFWLSAFLVGEARKATGQS